MIRLPRRTQAYPMAIPRTPSCRRKGMNGLARQRNLCCVEVIARLSAAIDGPIERLLITHQPAPTCAVSNQPSGYITCTQKPPNDWPMYKHSTGGHGTDVLQINGVCIRKWKLNKTHPIAITDGPDFGLHGARPLKRFSR